MVVGGKGVMMVEREAAWVSWGYGTGGEALVEDAGSGWKDPETLRQQWPGCHQQWAECRHDQRGMALAEPAALVPATEARHGWWPMAR